MPQQTAAEAELSANCGLLGVLRLVQSIIRAARVPGAVADTAMVAVGRRGRKRRGRGGAPVAAAAPEERQVEPAAVDVVGDLIEQHADQRHQDGQDEH